jgi:hypothetical protein
MYKQLSALLLFAVLFLLISCPVKAEQVKNPDGNNVSIHFTPYLTDSKVKVFDKEGKDNQSFNFDLKLKMPLSQSITATAFYKSDDFDLGFIGIKKKSYGVTLSIYFE